MGHSLHGELAKRAGPETFLTLLLLTALDYIRDSSEEAWVSEEAVG